PGAPRVPGAEPRGLTGCLPGASRAPGEGAAQARRMLSGSATRPECGNHAGSPGAFRERHASRVREPRGLAGCLPGAPRVPSAGATRARRVSSGSATRPPTEKARTASREGAVIAKCPRHSVERTLVLLKAVPGLLLGRWAL